MKRFGSPHSPVLDRFTPVVNSSVSKKVAKKRSTSPVRVAADEPDILKPKGAAGASSPRSLPNQSPISNQLFWLFSLVACSTIIGFISKGTDLSASLPVAITLRTQKESCTEQAYDGGQWILKSTPPSELQSLQDIYTAFDVGGCRAEYQPTWNLGLRNPPVPPFDYRIKAMSFQWQPHPSCRLRTVNTRDKLRALVRRPLLIVGDSRSRQHFWSLSCDLYEHVTWKGSKPDVDSNHVGEWRFGRQHLHLNPASPLIKDLRLPSSFSFDVPIVSYVMMYTPLSRVEMRELPGVNTNILPDYNPSPAYPAYEVPKNTTLDLFLSTGSHYKIMLFSTGAHFGPSLFTNDFTASDAVSVARRASRDFFMSLQARMRSDQKVFVRAAGAGHSDCEGHSKPLDESSRLGWWYNFDYLADINHAVRDEVELTIRDSRFRWLGLERLSRLRPDAHLPGDCLHYAVGSGVFEAINVYLWHNIIS